VEKSPVVRRSAMEWRSSGDHSRSPTVRPWRCSELPRVQRPIVRSSSPSAAVADDERGDFLAASPHPCPTGRALLVHRDDPGRRQGEPSGVCMMRIVVRQRCSMWMSSGEERRVVGSASRQLVVRLQRHRQITAL